MIRFLFAALIAALASSAANATTVSQNLAIRVANQYDNSGNPWPLVGTIQAENYDVGGSGIGYSFAGTCGITTDPFRTDSINVKDEGTGRAVGCIDANAYLQYTINVSATGNYTLSPSVANVETGAILGLYFCDPTCTLLSTVAVPNTGAYTTFQSVVSGSFSATAGNHTLRIKPTATGATGYAGDFDLMIGQVYVPSACSGTGVVPIGQTPPGGGYAGIQNAVNNKAAGTTFCLAAGTYHETILALTGDTFWGAGIGQTIIDGQNNLVSGFQQGGGGLNNVTIKLMSIRNFTDRAVDGATSRNSGWMMDTIEVDHTQNGIQYGTNFTLKNSLVHDQVSHWGSLTGNGTAFSNVTITNNDFYNNNTSQVSPFGPTADCCMKFNGGGGDTYTNNRSHGNFGNTIWFDSNHQGATLTGNDIGPDTGAGSGIAIEIPMAQTTTTPIYTVSGNYIHNPVGMTNVGMANAGNVNMFNNALATAQPWYFLDEGSRPDVQGHATVVQNVSIHNNFIGFTQSTIGGQTGSSFNWEVGLNNSITNNTYFLGTTGQTTFQRSNGTNDTFAQWQAGGWDTAASGSTATANGGTIPSGDIPTTGFVCTAAMGTCP